MTGPRQHAVVRFIIFSPFCTLFFENISFLGSEMNFPQMNPTDPWWECNCCMIIKPKFLSFFNFDIPWFPKIQYVGLKRFIKYCIQWKSSIKSKGPAMKVVSDITLVEVKYWNKFTFMCDVILQFWGHKQRYAGILWIFGFKWLIRCHNVTVFYYITLYIHFTMKKYLAF